MDDEMDDEDPDAHRGGVLLSEATMKAHRKELISMNRSLSVSVLAGVLAVGALSAQAQHFHGGGHFGGGYGHYGGGYGHYGGGWGGHYYTPHYDYGGYYYSAPLYGYGGYHYSYGPPVYYYGGGGYYYPPSYGYGYGGGCY